MPSSNGAGDKSSAAKAEEATAEQEEGKLLTIVQHLTCFLFLCMRGPSMGDGELQL